MTEREKSDFNEPLKPTSSRSFTDQDSGPPVKKQKTSGQSLLDIWTKSSRNMTTIPFAGMRSVGDKARLYLNLERKEKEQSVGHNEDLH